MRQMRMAAIPHSWVDVATDAGLHGGAFSSRSGA